MVNLTFGEQVKVILNRRGMTIKELAELVEAHTGKPMSRQNMTQRLSRDNFQEQDMRMIAGILGCPFTLSIMEPVEGIPQWATALQGEEAPARDITIGELVQMEDEAFDTPEDLEEPERVQEVDGETFFGALEAESEEKNILKKGIRGYFRKGKPVAGKEAAEQPVPIVAKEMGEINPYTQKEYETNSVRIHPKQIGYVQVYDQEQHKWTDMTEWAFLGYQERKKKLLGKDYKPPIYLD